MKKLIAIAFLLSPIVAVVAQDMPDMSEELMQKMQTCMEGIDQSGLQAFEQRSSKMDSELKALCASGKRDEAQQMAISFAQEVAKTPALQEIKKCGEIMKGAVPNMPLVKDTDYSSRHVCDN